ncbi:hypothetical protein BHE74_00050528, partial [Ensete ventricosum]
FFFLIIKSRAYVVDVVGLDRNEIVSVGKWGAGVRAVTRDGEGCGRGQRCSYVVGEVTIEEEGSDDKQGKQRRLKERAVVVADEGFGCGCNC